ncbi:hypothetical protein SSX86_001291 [Deinandra increscens subsp. villosa]|uniref:HMA domain-containing protein n=1 Tax=Deinandra increscens subsp. villosa TaxID=3103831 RepID=A0AAP0H925_9ASTR
MAESKKTVVKVDVHDKEDKRKAMKAVSSHPGVESIAIKDQTITVIGVIDPVCVARTLEKWHPEILTVGPAKDEKKDEKNDDKNKKEERIYYPCGPPPQCCVHIVEETPNSCGML